MKQMYLFRFLFPMLASLLLISCSDEFEDEPNVEKPVTSVPWSKVENLNRDVYNSQFINEKLTILDRNYLYYDAQVDAVGNPQSIVNFLTRLGRYRLPLSKSIFVSRSETEVFIFPNTAVNSDNAMVLDPKIVDPNFSTFEDIPFWQGEVLGMDPEGSTVLIPYRTTENGFATNNPNYLFLKTGLEDGKVVIKEQKLIKEQVSSYFVETNKIRSMRNFFLILVEGKSYKVNLNGEIELIANSALTAVEFENQVFFFEEKRSEGKVAIYVSDIYGGNISPIGEFDLSLEKLGANYSVADNQIIGFSGRNIFLVTLNNNSVQTQMLNNQGIDGSISSITEVGTDNVLITLIRSGQGGAVTKPIANFIDKIK